MRLASLPSSSNPRRLPISGRAIAFLLALIANILLILALLGLAPNPFVTPPEPQTFRLLPDQPPEQPPESVSEAKVKKAAGGSSAKGPQPAAPAKRAAASPAPPTPAPVMPKLLAGGMDLFEAGDISKMPSHADENGGGDGNGSGKDSKAAYGPGEGPGGERLYDVDWYRRPTHAELAGYLPNGAPPGGYALIACRMVENYRVENCRALGESPIGSGLARAMRQAAWQFRVQPPRIGGKKILGGWVRIRIDFGSGPDGQ